MNEGARRELKTGHTVPAITTTPQHVVLTCSRADNHLQVYINGELIGEGSVPEVSVAEVPTDIIWLGRSLRPFDLFLKGNYAEVRVYNQILSAERVSSNKQLGPDDLGPDAFVPDAGDGDAEDQPE